MCRCGTGQWLGLPEVMEICQTSQLCVSNPRPNVPDCLYPGPRSQNSFSPPLGLEGCLFPNDVLSHIISLDQWAVLSLGPALVLHRMTGVTWELCWLQAVSSQVPSG